MVVWPAEFRNITVKCPLSCQSPGHCSVCVCVSGPGVCPVFAHVDTFAHTSTASDVDFLTGHAGYAGYPPSPSPSPSPAPVCPVFATVSADRSDRQPIIK